MYVVLNLNYFKISADYDVASFSSYNILKFKRKMLVFLQISAKF